MSERLRLRKALSPSRCKPKLSQPTRCGAISVFNRTNAMLIGYLVVITKLNKHL